MLLQKLITALTITAISAVSFMIQNASAEDEKRKVIEEGEGIYGVKEVIASIILVEDLSRNKS